jgi:hypothetical protein
LLQILDFVLFQKHYPQDIHGIIKRTIQLLKQSTEEKPAIKQKENTFTTSQQILFFHYLLGEIGINFGNSDKSQWIRLIHSFTGKNAQDIKEKLNFNFDDKKTKRDLRIVADHIQELIPQIAIKIKNDTQE